MNNITNNYSNVNFQAKLDISRIKGSSGRWKEVAAKFEELTGKTQDYTFKGYDSFESGLAFDLVDKHNVVHTDCCFSEKGSQKLAELTNSEIAQKLSKIFDLLKKHTEIENQAAAEYNKKNIVNASMETENKFWQNVTRQMNEVTDEIIGDDEFLKKGLLYY